MKNIIFFFMMAVAMVFASCLKTVDYSKLSTNFVVGTNFDKSVSFSTFKTYYIADTVINLGGTGIDTVLTGAPAQQLVNAVTTNMNSRGYQFVARRAHPDLGLRLGIVKVTTVNIYPGWYTGYPGWGPYYWGGYYPYYYPWTTVYTYDTGTVILDAYNVRDAAVNGQYKAVWTVVGFGALGSTATNTTLGVNAINQGFKQSPYIQTH
jgi:hypothetical protein